MLLWKVMVSVKCKSNNSTGVDYIVYVIFLEIMYETACFICLLNNCLLMYIYLLTQVHFSF